MELRTLIQGLQETPGMIKEATVKEAEHALTKMARLHDVEKTLLDKVAYGEIRNDVNTFIRLRDKLMGEEKTASMDVTDMPDFGEPEGSSPADSTATSDSYMASLASKYYRGGA